MKLICGDSKTSLKDIPDESVQTCVTSPPYYGLRDYGMEGQVGLEDTPEAYVESLVSVFREVKRVLKDDGTVWLNLGDSYWGGKGQSSQAWSTEHQDRNTLQKAQHQITGKGETRPTDGKHPVIKPKDLIGIPWMVAFALRADGWYLRSDIIWAKPNPMPESVTDRPTKSHEYIFLLSKSAQYFYDAEAIKEPCAESTPARMLRGVSDNHKKINGAPGQTPHSMNKPRRKVDSWEERKAAGAGSGSLENGHNASIAKGAGFSHTLGDGMTRNRRDVWTVTTKPFKGSHFAVFPPDLIEPCILAGTSERGECPNCGKAWVRVVEREKPPEIERSDDAKRIGMIGRNDNNRRMGAQLQDWYDEHPKQTTGWTAQCDCNAEPVPQIVLDPFNGAGTSGVVSIKNGRDYIGIDLNPKYIELTKKRLEKVQLVIRQEHFGG